MLNEVADDAIVKVVHLCPWDALAKGDAGYRNKFQKTFKDLARCRLSLMTLQRTFRKANHSERSLVSFSSQLIPPTLVEKKDPCNNFLNVFPTL